MNIFYLDHDPKLCAEMHVDKHCVKMILETAQLLCTAHRILDGTQYISSTKNGRTIQRWKLNDHREDILYSATHANHPSAIWVRQSKENYDWLYELFLALIDEYSYRYEKIHQCSALIEILKDSPKNISVDKKFTEPTPAMPEEYKVDGNSTQSYKNYYLGDKQRMFSWKNRNIPIFVTEHDLI